MNQSWSCNTGKNEKGKASVSWVLKYGNGSEGDQLIGDNTCISGYSVFTLQIFVLEANVSAYLRVFLTPRKQ